jgi:hypothetical protein
LETTRRYRYEVDAWQESTNRSNSAEIHLVIEGADWAEAQAKAKDALPTPWQYYTWHFAVRRFTEIEPPREPEPEEVRPEKPSQGLTRGFRYRGAY